MSVPSEDVADPRVTSRVRDLAALGALVADGDTVALGGGWSANHPMAAVRQLIRAGRRDLHAIAMVGSVDIDLLAGAGVLGHVSFSMVTLEAFGLAPSFRAGIESGAMGFTEYTGAGLVLGLEAQGRGVPFIPYRGPLEAELPKRYPDAYQVIECPFTGERLTATRAIRPDVAIVHATRCDAEGNAQWEGTSGCDVEMAKAAGRVIVTCEEIVPRDRILANPHATKLPGFYVDAVIEAPFGAHPCSHAPLYGVDAWEIREHARADIGVRVSQLRGESEEEYRARVLGPDRAPVLQALAQGDDT